MNADEQKTAQKIVHVLNQSARDLSGPALVRLAAAREQALNRYHEAPGWRLAWAGQLASRVVERPTTGLRYALPMTVLILGLIGIVYWQSGNGRSSELADIDARLLADDLPIDAYLDKGFDSWLKRQSR